tara:strand:- start:650 stop:1495 length:846 start_codon:yes stop_codon:yes gene_type:complete
MNTNIESEANNFGVTSTLHVENSSGITINLASSWFKSNDEANALIFDAYDDPLRGPINFNLMSSPFLSDSDASSDDDSDGHSLLEEYVNESCPHLSDSDSDGMSDFDDTYPLDKRYKLDSDMDGLPDSWESLYGLNPNDYSDRDSDFDNDGVTAIDEFTAGSPAGLIDIDGDGQYNPLSDGLLILRSMFGFRGQSLIDGVVSSKGAFQDATEIQERIDMLNLGNLMDIDGQGGANALTDGMLSLRYLFGITGETLVDGVISSDAVRNNPDEIEKYLKALMN